MLAITSRDLNFFPTPCVGILKACKRKHISDMNNLIPCRWARALAILLLAASSLPAQTNSAPPLFPDKNLEAAVRKLVYEKRDNTNALLEADVVNLSTLPAAGMKISSLAGLEKCRSLASLDLSGNAISDLAPLKSLTNIQYLNLASNSVSDLAPLVEIKALQYIELSHNQVKGLQPLSQLTNLTSLYLTHNQVSDLAPLLKLPRLTTLYLDQNSVQNIQGINALTRLSMLSLSRNGLTDIAALDGLTSLSSLFLEHNKIANLTPLVTMLKKDADGPQHFAPFINIYLTGNPAPKSQISKLKAAGARVTP